jgi:hypothetical protein
VLGVLGSVNILFEPTPIFNAFIVLSEASEPVGLGGLGVTSIKGPDDGLDEAAKGTEDSLNESGKDHFIVAESGGRSPCLLIALGTMFSIDLSIIIGLNSVLSALPLPLNISL